MSITANANRIREEARNAYLGELRRAATAEHNAMNEMLGVLHAAPGWMTAAQIEAACASGISKHEIAGNLRAMYQSRSRYDCVRFAYGEPIPAVKIPKVRGNSEHLIIKKGGRRKAMVVEIDENGWVIPDTKREIMVYDCNHYRIGIGEDE